MEQDAYYDTVGFTIFQDSREAAEAMGLELEELVKAVREAFQGLPNVEVLDDVEEFDSIEVTGLKSDILLGLEKLHYDLGSPDAFDAEEVLSLMEEMLTWSVTSTKWKST